LWKNISNYTKTGPYKLNTTKDYQTQCLCSLVKSVCIFRSCLAWCSYP